MALQLYMGNSGSGKSYAVYNKIIEASRKNKTEKFLILVPEQFTMQTQKKLVQMHPGGGILNIDILSFNRLAYRIFKETGCSNVPVIDEIGKTFIVRKVARQNQDELKALGSVLGKIGLVNEMKSLISEMLQYDISLEKLDEMIEMNKQNKALVSKLYDMKTVYGAFCDYKKEKYITSEEVLDVLCNNIEKSKWLRGMTIVLDGYTGFTPIQKRLVEKLMVMSKDIYITITFDAKYKIHSNYPDYSLFHMSSVMLRDIEKMAEKTGTKRLDDVIFKTNKRFSEEVALSIIEKNLFRSKKQQFIGRQDNFCISVCKNPLQEVLYTASTINYLVQKENYKFKDIAVVTGDMTVYGVYIKYIFGKYGINCFVDQKVVVLNHPAVEFLRAVMRVVLENFSYRSIMRFLRSDFSGFDKVIVDELENYILATGIKNKKKWNEMFIYQTRNADSEKLVLLNDIRVKICELINPFYDVFSKKSTTVIEKSTALFEFMQRAGLQQKIEQMAKSFENSGQQLFAREYSQIYKIILGVLDSLVSLLSDEAIEPKEYEKLLEAGFLEQKVGVIPPGFDEVIFGDIERSRLAEIKALFVLGANDGIIPKHSDNSGVLSELDRNILESQGVTLSTNSKEKYFNQKYYLYLTVTKPSDKLYICFSKTNSLGEAINPSYLIEELCNIFVDEKILNQEKLMNSVNSVNCSEQAFDFVVEHLNDVKMMPESEKAVYFEMYKYFAQNGSEEQLKKLRLAINYKRVDDVIDNAVAKALYGEVLEGSATRFELFAKCAYAHFLQYGLALKEREEAGFAGVDFGNIMHSLLEKYFKLLQEMGISLEDEASVSEELINKCIDEAITEYGNQAIYFSAREKYKITRMRRIAKRTLWALQKQFAAGKFNPSEFEIKFRSMYDILENDSVKAKIAVRGRIDRIDTYEQDDKVYIKIVDYKTGETKFSLLNIYYGTSLQLSLYLEEAKKLAERKNNKKTVIPAAVLYYNINDPIIENSEENKNIDDELLNSLKVNGLISEENEIVSAFDTEFENSPVSYKSKVVPIETNRDGAFASKSKTIPQNEFEIISKYAGKKISDIGAEIMDGIVEAKPALDLDKDICNYCRFSSICKFDVNNSEIKNTPNMKEAEIIAAMRESIYGSENESEKVIEENVEGENTDGK